VIRPLLHATADYATTFLDGLGERRVTASATADELRAALGGPLPDGPSDPAQVIDDLVAAADAGIVASPSARYFGFVIGGGVPAALAADWLTSTWDQNAGLYVAGPSASVVEEVAGFWLKELLALPQSASYAFVTGCQMAHVTALAAARQHLLAERGWDVARKGLYGAPSIRVVVGEERHVTVDRALRLLGMGAPVPVGSDEQGRLRAEDLAGALDDDAPTIVCAQVGNVNTGAVDDLPAILGAAHGAGAWVHVDGAFGMWAAASAKLRDLVRGIEQADSWATDCHKWLNVPYDSGLAFVADPEAHRAAIGVQASYLVQSEAGRERDQMDWTPEFSRRARGFAVYAAIRSLGRSGIAELVERCCRQARRFAEELGRAPGVEILNDVVLNQVLVRFADGRTPAIIQRVQEDGTCWLSGTTWQGEPAMRISVSNWQTSDADVERSVAAILAASD
jgi:glutamate/tyrosine decarboxylase-like PLP-dependent enzyme